MCITKANFMQIGRAIAEIWPFFDFSRWRPSAILDLLYACLEHTRKVKPRQWYFTICQDAPTGAINANFGMLGHIANVITHAKFCDNRFRGFGVLIRPNLSFSIGIAGRPYNSVSIIVQHCDKQTSMTTNTVDDTTYFPCHHTDVDHDGGWTQFLAVRHRSRRLHHWSKMQLLSTPRACGASFGVMSSEFLRDLLHHKTTVLRLSSSTE